MGGLSSYCRSFFGLLIPPDREAAFYALYAITDKGSSAVGPAIVGAIVDATGTIRPAFAFLAVLIALPAPLMWVVDAERGREDAIKMAGLGKGERRDTSGMDDGLQESEGLLNQHD
jgi:MFS transporter, UMF1 family